MLELGSIDLGDEFAPTILGGTSKVSRGLRMAARSCGTSRLGTEVFFSGKSRSDSWDMGYIITTGRPWNLSFARRRLNNG
jgi:hypothetical protein